MPGPGNCPPCAMDRSHWTVVLGLALCLALVGCGSDRLSVGEVHGAVTAGGQKVETGTVRFVPIDGTKGPATTARIQNGEYRADARGGVPLGKHRVEVAAEKKTGRKIKSRQSIEDLLTDETVPMAPQVYTGEDSPLVFELNSGSDGKYDIALPAVDSQEDKPK